MKRATLACGGSEYAREAVAALLAVDPVARAGASLAGLLEKNKYLNAGAKSTAAHAADELGCAPCVSVARSVAWLWHAAMLCVVAGWDAICRALHWSARACDCVRIRV